jgi:hypothetical protein
LVSGHYRDPKELATVPDEYNTEEGNQYIEQQIETINKTLPRGKQAVRGRGRYKGKIVSRNTQPSAEDISRYTAKVASRAVNNNIEELANLDECEDLEGMLEKMIMEEMMATRPATAPPIVRKRVGRPAKQQYDDEKYVVQDAPANDYEPNFSDRSETFNDEEGDYEFDENDFE